MYLRPFVILFVFYQETYQKEHTTLYNLHTNAPYYSLASLGEMHKISYNWILKFFSIQNTGAWRNVPFLFPFLYIQLLTVLFRLLKTLIQGQRSPEEKALRMLWIILCSMGVCNSRPNCILAIM